MVSPRSTLRRAATRAVSTGTAGAVLSLLERADRGRGDTLAVLTYHRVIERTEARGVPGLVSASPAQFAQQMAFLAKRFRVVGLNDLLEVKETGRPIGPRAVLITFDDAYRDFATGAWPVLRNLALPVTVFVPTGYPDHPERGFWWDWLYEALMTASTGDIVRSPTTTFRLTSPDERLDAFRHLRAEVKGAPHDEAMALVADVAGIQLGVTPLVGQVLDWRTLESLARDGVALAPHTRSHALLDRLDEASVRSELMGSMADLEERIGATSPALAYPSGAYSTAVREAVAQAGFAVAFTTSRGLNRLGSTDWLTLRRINVGAASSLNVIRAQLGRWAAIWSR